MTLSEAISKKYGKPDTEIDDYNDTGSFERDEHFAYALKSGFRTYRTWWIFWKLQKQEDLSGISLDLEGVDTSSTRLVLGYMSDPKFLRNCASEAKYNEDDNF